MNLIFLIGFGLLAAAPNMAIGVVEEVEKAIHVTSLGIYGAINMAGMAVVVWVRRQLNRRIPRCLAIAAIGAVLWFAGLMLHHEWLLLIGVALMSFAHVCECTFHFRRLCRHCNRCTRSQQ